MLIALPDAYEAVDAHNHVYLNGQGELDRPRAAALLDGAERLGIAGLCVSSPLTDDCPTPEQVRRHNDIVIEAMAMSDRFQGFCFVNPGFAGEACDEIRRCLDAGMVGIKLYHQYRVCDPAQTAVMALAADKQVPVLMHAGRVTDSVTRSRQPRLSDASHFLKAAAMFPETMLIQGHIGGGGDWEWNLRILEACPPNLFIDISGSVVDSGIVRRTVESVGVEHVLFATDGSLEEGVGKLLAARLPEPDLKRIAGATMRGLLSRRRV